MNQNPLLISEYHLEEPATPDDAKRVIALLTAEGWLVEYGERPWHFDDLMVRTLFEQAFLWACEVAKLEQRPFDEEAMMQLVRQRFQINQRLKPYESQLLSHQIKWSGYLKWLIETPAESICKWLKPDDQNSVSKD